MAKISNTLSYPNQSPIEGADYLIGTAANSTPIDRQTKTFTLQGIAEFVIDEAFDGCSYRLPIFTAPTSGEESFKLVNSLFYQDTATTDSKDPCETPAGSIVYLDDGSGIGSLIVAENVTIGKQTIANGLVNVNGGIYFASEVYDNNNTVGTGEQVLVSQTDGTVEWQNYQGSGLEFQGAWNADTNIPDLQAISLIPANTGKYWIVSVEGTTPLNTQGGGTITDWEIGDWAIISEDLNNNIFWDKIDNSSVLTGQGTPGNLAIWTTDSELGDAPVKLGAGNVSLIFNNSSTADGDYSNALGDNSIANGTASIAVGTNSQTDGNNSISVGLSTSAIGNGSVAMGLNSTATGDGSVAMGANTTASGNYSTALNNTTEASGSASFASGLATEASGQSSTAMGSQTTASGNQSTAIGNQSTASGIDSSSFGKGNISSGLRSVTIGSSQEASAQDSISIGGQPNTASGIQSVSIGTGNEASGVLSHIIGAGNLAEGNLSTLIGHNNTAFLSSENSTAIGFENSLTGMISYAFGSGLEVTDFRQTVLGSFNSVVGPGSVDSWNTTDNLFIIGNGTGIVSTSNALELRKDGELKLNTYGSGQVAGTATYNLSVDANGRVIETPDVVTPTFIMTGLINNLGSQTQGYDFMEWTSNVTAPTQIPLWRTPLPLKLKLVTWVWMGSSPLNIIAGDSISFTIGTIPDGLSATIGNYTPVSTTGQNIFTLDGFDSGTYAAGQADVSSFGITIDQFSNTAVVGAESGVVGPNDGELAICLYFEESIAGANRTMTYNIENNIIGPAAGYTITGDLDGATDTGMGGVSPYSFATGLQLNPGYSLISPFTSTNPSGIIPAGGGIANGVLTGEIQQDQGPGETTVCDFVFTDENSTITDTISGGAIPIATNAAEFYAKHNAGLPVAAYWDFDSNNSERGLLYNQFAARQIQPPTGFRLPTSPEWNLISDTPCNDSYPNQNRYGSNPGNWAGLTDTTELGDADFNLNGYGGVTLASNQVFFVEDTAREYIWTSTLSSSGNWNACHVGLASNEGIALDLSGAAFTGMGSNGGITYANLNATTFGFATGSVGVDSVNKSGDEFIAYCFHSVSGYSKFGSYTGGGNTNPTINVGFAPDWLMVKKATGTATGSTGWTMVDSARHPGTPTYDNGNVLYADDNLAEQDDDNERGFIITSTGFSPNGNYFSTNNSGDTYIYMAFKMN